MSALLSATFLSSALVLAFVSSSLLAMTASKALLFLLVTPSSPLSVLASLGASLFLLWRLLALWPLPMLLSTGLSVLLAIRSERSIGADVRVVVVVTSFATVLESFVDLLPLAPIHSLPLAVLTPVPVFEPAALGLDGSSIGLLESTLLAFGLPLLRALSTLPGLFGLRST